MAYRLIGQDCAVQISVSTAAHTGADPTYGSAVNIKTTGRARRVGIREELLTSDVSALGDSREKLRARRGKTSLEIENLVLDTGWLYYSSGTLIGYVAKLEIKEISSLGSFKTWKGLITEWSGETPDGESVERITIACDADGVL